MQQKFFDSHVKNGECMVGQVKKQEKEERIRKMQFDKFRNEEALRI